VTDYVLVTNPAGGYRNLDDIKKASRVVRYGRPVSGRELSRTR
jgi:hypothetical protein